MATPLPFPGLTALLGLLGRLLASLPSPVSVPEEQQSIAAIIPALNEEKTLPYALVSLAIQTVTPDLVVVVDDGSTDDTLDITCNLAEHLDLNVELWQHDRPMGKTVGVKEVARSLDTDLLFVLDADTFLESDDYLERLCTPHANGDVASSFGTVTPTDDASKHRFYHRRIATRIPADSTAATYLRDDLVSTAEQTGVWNYLTSNDPVVQFRTLTFQAEQRFFRHGFMRLFDSTLFPVGCGVMYDREKLVSVFDYYEQTLGDDLTASEDIFVGFAFCERGWRNVHVEGAQMRSAVPTLRGAFEQNYLWGSGFLQSAFCFERLSQRFRTQRVPQRNGADIVRKPLGRAVLARVVDGLYPTAFIALVALAFLGVVPFLIPGLLLLWEFGLYVAILAATASDRRKLAHNLLPFVVVRLVMLPVLTVTYGRFLVDLVTGNRSWRK
jgi:glycosyltransferase involved in cell wall biosynthesis